MIIALTVTGTVLSVALYIIQQKESEIAIQTNDDKANKNKLDIINALAEHNLEFSERQKKVIEILRDSLKTKTTIITTAEPLITFCPDFGIKMTKNTDKEVVLKYYVCCYGSACRQIRLNSKIIVRDEKDDSFHVLTDVKNDDVTESFRDNSVPAGSHVWSELTIQKQDVPPKQIFLYLYGTFEGESKKIYKVETWAAFDTEANQFGIPNAYQQRRLTDLVAKPH